MSNTIQKKQIQKPRIGIYGLTGCAGDQLLIIHTEDEILNLFGAADIRSFVMASSSPIEEELDVALIEGSVSTQEQADHVKEIRERAKIVVAIGNCATVGGVQAMYAETGTYEKRLKQVYGDVDFTVTQPIDSKPIDEYITVDYYLPGCCIDQKQTFTLLARLIHGAAPEPNTRPVCHECKLNENDCLLLHKEFCLGPLTQAGCGSVCTNHGLPCVGCWGPNPDGNFKSHFRLLESFGLSREEVTRRVRNYGGHKILKYLEDI